MSDIAGLPFWELHFDKTGTLLRHVGAIPAQLTDLFVFAHAWNNDYNDAKDLFDVFFEALAQELVEHGAKADVPIGLAGVYWPSILWPGDEPLLERTGAPLFGPVEAHWSDELKKAYDGTAEHDAIDRMRELIETRPTHPQAVEEFKTLLRALAPEGSEEIEDLAALAPEHAPEQQGYPDALSRVWQGAEWALRLTTYSEIATRAIRVGDRGLGGFLATLPDTLRVHLLGHSFGSGLVGSAVQKGARKVHSVFLMGVEPGDVSFVKPQPVVDTHADILDPEVARAVLKTAGVV